MKIKGACYLCGRPATTFDHIPPKSLFPKDYQYKGLKVPACKECNNFSSKNDEYLRDSFAITGWNKEARKVFLEGVVPSYKRPYSILQSKTKLQRILNSMTKVEVKTPNGIFLRKETGYKMKTNRINSSLEKIVRGIYFYHHKISLPKNYNFTFYYQPQDVLESIIKQAHDNKTLTAVRFGNTFSYAYIRIKEDRFVSVWWLTFYQTHAIIVIVDSPNKLLG